MMKNRISYYVSRKNVLVWLAALVMVCSAIARIAYFCGKGADAATVWFQIVLPVAASLIYVLILLCSGEERLYRTAVPVFMAAIYFGIRISSMDGMWRRYILLCWIAYMAFAVAYAVIISGKGGVWLLPLMYLAALGVLLYDSRAALHAENIGIFYANLPDMLLLLPGLLVSLVVKVHLDNKYHPTWGDRPDGYKLRTVNPMTRMMPYIMPQRADACNYFADSIDMTKTDRFCREKVRAGMTNFGFLHILIASYIRAISQRPALNRFVSGQKIYARKGIQIVMVVKKRMAIDSPDTCIKVDFEPDDTVDEVYEKFDRAVSAVREAPDDRNEFDRLNKILSLIPGLFCRWTIGLLRFLDYFGIMPRKILRLSPFHGTMIVTSMGSLGIRPIYHHIYNFGNLPVFFSYGGRRSEVVCDADGNVSTRKCIELKVVTDERICDGYYYASAFKIIKRHAENPELLEVKPETVCEDIL